MPLAIGRRKKNDEHFNRISDLLSRTTEEVSENESPSIEEQLDNINLQQNEDINPGIDESDLWIVKYDELAQKTKSIPLSHLGCCKEGGELFNDLCMWVDINQKYVDLGLFPQWDDIARELNIDEMKTEWVRVCIRPEQSFTRAILEIYMNDGGTLGDVISALRKQQQYRIIQEISDKAEEFMDVYNTYHKHSLNAAETGVADPGTNVHLYSILKTLFDTFTKAKQEDPLNKFQLYSGGFKQYLKSLSDGPKPSSNDVIVNAVHFNEPPASVESQDSGYTSPYRYEGNLPSMTESNLDPKLLSQIRERRSSLKKDISGVEKGSEEQDSKTKYIIRILLVFAKDGVSHADAIVSTMFNFTIPVMFNLSITESFYI